MTKDELIQSLEAFAGNVEVMVYHPAEIDLERQVISVSYQCAKNGRAPYVSLIIGGLAVPIRGETSGHGLRLVNPDLEEK